MKLIASIIEFDFNQLGLTWLGALRPSLWCVDSSGSIRAGLVRLSIFYFFDDEELEQPRPSSLSDHAWIHETLPFVRQNQRLGISIVDLKFLGHSDDLFSSLDSLNQLYSPVLFYPGVFHRLFL